MEILHESEFRNHTLALTLSGDGGRPILDHSAYERLSRELDRAEADDEVRVVILKGLSGCFCLGGDLSEFLDPSKHETLIKAVSGMFRRLARFSKPMLGCVDGDAIGVGCTVLFHCDLVYASPKSTFRVPFVDLGLVPDAATSLLAPEKLGYASAFRFFCLGETLKADAALKLGLISDLVEDTDPETRARQTARRLAKKPARALSQTRMLLKGDSAELCNRIDREISLFHNALQDEATIRRLKRVSRMAA
ncbi:enoyl-CoA hydratase-related protein [Aquibium oceanicum]|uniref:Crotonase n=1 Tax=Aquibium oceanicum TaxID=1670800 RepID=A0A1L3SVN6_9HYPH|nr:enoyl-CoA hydratase-related protein [Aquibium oceanicum]APH73448.1 crotonase [Aquibium oceanicum]